MVWTEEWTVDIVANNFKAIGIVDPEDIIQLIEDSKELRKCQDLLRKARRHISSVNTIGAMEVNKQILEYFADAEIKS